MPTFEDIDNYWAGNTTNPYATPTAPSLAQTTSPSNTSSSSLLPPLSNLAGTYNPTAMYSPIQNIVGNLPSNSTNTSNTSSSSSVTLPFPKPTPPRNPASPAYANTLGNMYTQTFTDPNSMWDEYNQGQGVNFTQGAARAMAKSGRTGMLPTLNSLAHQDYMSNYLPSVRKDLAPGLGYENTWNQNLTQKYGQDQDFASKNYGTDASMYGQGLTYASNMAQVAAQVQDIGVKEKLGMLDADLKMYGIDNDTIQQIYASMATMFPKMTAQDQNAMVNELQLALSINKAGNVGLADLTNPVGTTPAPAATPTQLADTTNKTWSDYYGG